jgi:phage-related minor tail protein
LTANPIGLIITAIGALIGLVILAVKHLDDICAALSRAWEWMKNVAAMIRDGLVNAFKTTADWVSKNTEKVLGLITVFTGPFGFIISIIKELRENWGAIVEAFQTDGIIAGFKKLGGVILSAVLAPIQGLLEILAKIPGVDKLLGPAVEKIQDFRNTLKGVEDISAEVSAVTPQGLTQTTTAGMVSPAVGAATIQPTTPMTPAQQQAYYSRSESSETVNVDVRAMPGTQVRQLGRARSPNVKVTASGDNF